jgi:hypothetical protein
MDEQAEKAAKWDMLQELKAEQDRLALLRKEAERIGEALELYLAGVGRTVGHRVSGA